MGISPRRPSPLRSRPSCPPFFPRSLARSLAPPSHTLPRSSLFLCSPSHSFYLPPFSSSLVYPALFVFPTPTLQPLPLFLRPAALSLTWSCCNARAHGRAHGRIDKRLDKALGRAESDLGSKQAEAGALAAALAAGAAGAACRGDGGADLRAADLARGDEDRRRIKERLRQVVERGEQRRAASRGAGMAERLLGMCEADLKHAKPGSRCGYPGRLWAIP